MQKNIFVLLTPNHDRKYQKSENTCPAKQFKQVCNKTAISNIQNIFKILQRGLENTHFLALIKSVSISILYTPYNGQAKFV